jgi:hypothetical protein
MLKGGCFCGDIRYEAGGKPFYRTNCHCSICRRTTGAPFVAWFSVPRSEFRLVQGDSIQINPRVRAEFLPTLRHSVDLRERRGLGRDRRHDMQSR